MDYSKKIVGSWSYHYKVNGIVLSGVDTYLSSGQVITNGRVKRPHVGSFVMEHRASWKIRGGVLITVHQEGKHKRIGIPGGRCEAKITFSLDKRAFKLENTRVGKEVKRGTAKIFHRVKSQSGKGDI